MGGGGRMKLESSSWSHRRDEASFFSSWTRHTFLSKYAPLHTTSYAFSLVKYDIILCQSQGGGDITSTQELVLCDE